VSTTVRPKTRATRGRLGTSSSSAIPSSASSATRPRLGIRDELPALIAAGYEAVPEEDIVRLQWWGCTTTNPRSARSCCASSCPRASSSPPSCARSARSRIATAVVSGSSRHDRTSSCTTCPWRVCPTSSPSSTPRGSRPPAAAATPCATSRARPCRGSTRSSCSTARRFIQEAAEFFYGNPELLEPPAQAQVIDRGHARFATNAPEINCIALVGAIHEGQEGFGVLVGGGLSSVAAHRQGARRLRPQGRGRRGARGDHRRLGRRPELPREPASRPASSS